MYAQLLRFSRWGFGGGAFFKRHLPQRKLTAKHFFDRLSRGIILPLLSNQVLRSNLCLQTGQVIVISPLPLGTRSVFLQFGQ